jgi:uncharacterized PurR-regulated membrane protein YhhQ (DUF165 family)
MRATLSTLTSQFIDTVVVSSVPVLFTGIPVSRVTGIALVGYTYKFDLPWLAHPDLFGAWMDRTLLVAKAAEMKLAAMRKG